MGCPYNDECSADPSTDCSRTNVTYMLTCNQCSGDQVEGARHQYIGCTGKSLHARNIEHKKDVKGGDLTNAMAKHMDNEHEGVNVGFKSTVLASHRSCLIRMIDESIRIENGESSVGLANSKSEWGAGALVRLVPNRR